MLPVVLYGFQNFQGTQGQPECGSFQQFRLHR